MLARAPGATLAFRGPHDLASEGSYHRALACPGLVGSHQPQPGHRSTAVLAVPQLDDGPEQMASWYSDAMKDKLAKVFPVAVGAAIGWVLVYPPGWLEQLGYVRYAIVALLALALVLGATIMVVLKNLPERLEIVPLETPPAGTDQVDALIGRLAELGFGPAGPLYRVEVSPAAMLRGMVHQKLPIHAAIYRTGTLPAVTTFDLVSILSDERGGLTTTPEPRGVSLPAFPGSLRQAIASTSLKALLDQHCAAMEMLEHRGLRWRRVSSADLITDMQRAIARHRRAFVTAPIRNALITIWRSATGRYPEARPLSQQADLEPRIQEILSGRTVDAGQG